MLIFNTRFMTVLFLHGAKRSTGFSLISRRNSVSFLSTTRQYRHAHWGYYKFGKHDRKSPCFFTRLYSNAKDSESFKTNTESNDKLSTYQSLHTGDWAGHSASFNLHGRLLTVPEHYVPKAMIEWGQIPTTLEVLTSEQVVPNPTKVETATLTVLPEVGCGVDNLETLKQAQTLNFEKASDDGNVMAFDVKEEDGTAVWVAKESNDKLRMEVRFLDEDFNSVPFGTDLEEMSNTTTWRTRLVLTAQLRPSSNTSATRWKVVNPLTLVYERRTSLHSTNGTLADGGGLDGRTVARLVGKEAMARPFVTDYVQPQDQDEEKEEEEDGEICESDDVAMKQCLYLPANLTLQYGWEKDLARWEVTVRCPGAKRRRPRSVVMSLDPEGNTCWLLLT